MYSARHVCPVGFSPVVERPPLLLTPQTHSVTRGRGAGYAPCSVCNAPTRSLCFCIMVALVLHKCLFQVVLGWYWGHVDVWAHGVNEMLSTPITLRSCSRATPRHPLNAPSGRQASTLNCPACHQKQPGQGSCPDSGIRILR